MCISNEEPEMLRAACHDCPFRREGHIDLKNAGEFGIKVVHGMESICHNTIDSPCRGVALYRDNQRSPGFHREIEDDLATRPEPPGWNVYTWYRIPDKKEPEPFDPALVADLDLRRWGH